MKESEQRARKGDVARTSFLFVIDHFTVSLVERLICKHT